MNILNHDSRSCAKNPEGMDRDLAKAGAELHELLIFRLHNNQLTQLPSAYVTEFVEDANRDPPTKYCLVTLTLENNPFSENRVASGSLSEFLTAYGSRDPKGPANCVDTASEITDVEVLGLGGTDLGTEVTDEEQTALELLTDDFADADRYSVLYDFSFGWDGLTINDDILNAVPTQHETQAIRGASFDSAVTGATFPRFTTSSPVTTDLESRRLGSQHQLRLSRQYCLRSDGWITDP